MVGEKKLLPRFSTVEAFQQCELNITLEINREFFLNEGRHPCKNRYSQEMDKDPVSYESEAEGQITEKSLLKFISFEEEILLTASTFRRINVACVNSVLLAHDKFPNRHAGHSDD
jgi:hypothetical protein